MKNPKYFFTIIKGLIKGSKASKLYKKAPLEYDEQKVIDWSNSIKALDIEIPKY